MTTYKSVQTDNTIVHINNVLYYINDSRLVAIRNNKLVTKSGNVRTYSDYNNSRDSK